MGFENLVPWEKYLCYKIWPTQPTPWLFQPPSFPPSPPPPPIQYLMAITPFFTAYCLSPRPPQIHLLPNTQFTPLKKNSHHPILPSNAYGIACHHTPPPPSWQSPFPIHCLLPIISIIKPSVADPDSDPPDPHGFGPPGPGFTSPRYGSGSGSFYRHAKIVRKTLIYTILWLFLTCYLWKMM